MTSLTTALPSRRALLKGAAVGAAALAVGPARLFDTATARPPRT